MKHGDIFNFVVESNRIEGITRPPTTKELEAHIAILNLSSLKVEDIARFVDVIVPGHKLRLKAGVNVRVGNYVAPPGGQEVGASLSHLLFAANCLHDSPYNLHCAYELLHPFTDGNGRSGRVIWLWTMQHDGQLNRALGLGFLHAWYYQSLEGKGK